MNWTLLAAALVPCLACAPSGEKSELSTLAPAERPDAPIQIEFPRDGYTFTLAEAANGITIRYKIIANRACQLVALRSGPSFNDPPGPSRLYPRQQISGNNQNYCLEDFGLAQPPPEEVATLHKGVYEHSFNWDGRNWTGPSDFNNPKGPPFPSGTYDLTVTIHGKLITNETQTPYHITARTKLTLR